MRDCASVGGWASRWVTKGDVLVLVFVLVLVLVLVPLFSVFKATGRVYAGHGVAILDRGPSLIEDLMLIIYCGYWGDECE